ncbi:hypothetical protein BU23DRAFT_21678 [Bimuria novae-zelandiae CBS 107.79]|uniref:Uncharacterized protein n=1 Tax=Bimuria novae-zelandiae CBS 107.79 TaxID=1447943 RepID=A0A6A5UK50_9PLEO|nr:hypothetical protein BU23DRAFT_21678 [Bimuria novae-zelandiae CBS 107.79]
MVVFTDTNTDISKNIICKSTTTPGRRQAKHLRNKHRHITATPHANPQSHPTPHPSRTVSPHHLSSLSTQPPSSQAARPLKTSTHASPQPRNHSSQVRHAPTASPSPSQQRKKLIANPRRSHTHPRSRVPESSACPQCSTRR